MTLLRDRLKVYLIMGSQNCDRDPADILHDAIQGGITAFQFREKGAGSLEGDAKLALGKKLRAICRDHDVLFFVNDDLDLVEPLEADGIHVGQDDASAKEVRRQFPDKIIGLSVSNTGEVGRSPLNVVDYLGAGPVFATTSKHDAKAPVGPEWIETLQRDYPGMPIVGIGGITTDNAQLVFNAGAAGVSVISAVTEADDPRKAVQKLKACNRS
ncbi:Thiamine phosphate synthase [Lentibacillus sp. JNUCC-1]|uniref:thiamine phosphate synthase n=1 Tax=Lentibacillus sp. JNUCC-1 TaxID=2654513 RepID=UPI0012E74114|nr:thiamine phosphate synthase [Lentibacillus sp. JNUCC-1]MUV36745.1 Thiamine phosphate synthase [Lentibacillus sp. JNUCC-1]